MPSIEHMRAILAHWEESSWGRGCATRSKRLESGLGAVFPSRRHVNDAEAFAKILLAECLGHI
jgi:hypothetical protein